METVTRRAEVTGIDFARKIVNLNILGSAGSEDDRKVFFEKDRHDDYGEGVSFYKRAYEEDKPLKVHFETTSISRSVVGEKFGRVDNLTVDGYADAGDEKNDESEVPEEVREFTEKWYRGDESVEDVERREAAPIEEFKLDLFIAISRLRDRLEDEE